MGITWTTVGLILGRHHCTHRKKNQIHPAIWLIIPNTSLYFLGEFREQCWRFVVVISCLSIGFPSESFLFLLLSHWWWGEKGVWDGWFIEASFQENNNNYKWVYGKRILTLLFLIGLTSILNYPDISRQDTWREYTTHTHTR